MSLRGMLMICGVLCAPLLCRCSEPSEVPVVHRSLPPSTVTFPKPKPQPIGHFRATMSGAHDETFEGNGYWHTYERSNPSDQFVGVIMTSGTRELRIFSQANESFARRGTYFVSDDEATVVNKVELVLHDVPELFGAGGLYHGLGSVTISSVKEKRLVGSVEFEGTRSDAHDVEVRVRATFDLPCIPPRTIPGEYYAGCGDEEVAP